MRIAFAGNPNSGKTTMYNALTGRNEKIGNWGGVTVGSKEFKLKKEFAGDKEVIAVDLPGAYSMSPFTPEEGITSEYVRTANPFECEIVFQLLVEGVEKDHLMLIVPEVSQCQQ